MNSSGSKHTVRISRHCVKMFNFSVTTDLILKLVLETDASGVANRYGIVAK